MSDFIDWNSQPLGVWTEKHAKGSVIELDGLQTHYIEKGEGEPLILIHGFMYHSYLWHENINELAKHFRVFAIDLWGWGYSTRDNLDYSYALYSKQIKLFMEHLGLERASLAGQSMGGGTVIKFAVDNPQMADKLILVNCAGLPTQTPLIAKFFNLPFVGEFLLRLKTNRVRANILRDVFVYDKTLITDEYFDNVFLPHKIKGSIEVGLSIQRANFFHTLAEEIEQLATLNKDIMILWGENDKAVPYHKGLMMKEIFPRSFLTVYNDTGHVANFEQAEYFNQNVYEFLNEL